MGAFDRKIMDPASLLGTSTSFIQRLGQRDNVGYRFEQACSLTNPVTIHTWADRLNEANRLAPKLLEARRALYQLAPDRIDFAHGLAVALHTVGSLRIKSDAAEQAEALFIEAEGLFRGLIDRAPTSQELRTGLAQMQLNRAESARQKGDWARSVDFYQQTITLLQNETAESHPLLRAWIKQSYLGQASAYEALGDQRAMQACLTLASSLERQCFVTP